MKIPRKPSASSSLYARPWLLPLEQEILPVLLLHLLPEAPGALFWMWVSAFIGMITAYGETCLGIRFRLREPDGRFLCGPFLYMEHGLNVPFMAVLYSILCVMCALGMGSMVQANSAVTALSFTFNLPLWLPAVCFTLLTGAVIRGGIRSIGRTAERLVPAAAAIYVLFSLTVIPFLSSCPSPAY